MTDDRLRGAKTFSQLVDEEIAKLKGSEGMRQHDANLARVRAFVSGDAAARKAQQDVLTAAFYRDLAKAKAFAIPLLDPDF